MRSRRPGAFGRGRGASLLFYRHDNGGVVDNGNDYELAVNSCKKKF